MTVEELTSVINRLTEPERLELSRLASGILARRNSSHPAIRRYTRRSFINAIKKSYNESSNGQTKNLANFLAEIRDEYDLPA